MGEVLKEAVRSLPPHQTEVFKAVLEQLQWFAGQQIRNVAVSRFLKIVQYPLGVLDLQGGQVLLHLRGPFQDRTEESASYSSTG